MPRMGGYVPSDHKTRHQDGGRDEISIASLAGEPAELTTHKAVLDAHTKNIWEVLCTGQYYNTVQGTPAAAFICTANTLYAVAFLAARDITVDRIAVDVTTQAGQKIRLGIYNNGTNLYPGTLLLDAGEITLSGTGLQAIAISQALTKGIYWLALVTNGTPSVRKHATGSCVLGMGGTSWQYPAQAMWQVAFTYAALPTPFTAAGEINNGTDIIIGLRVLSLD